MSSAPYVTWARRGITRPDVTCPAKQGVTRLSTYSVRCKPCNRHHSALQRLWSKEPSLRDSFHSKFQHDEQSRAAFITRSRNLVGKELKAVVETAVKEKMTERSSTKRKTHIEFLDSPDLKKRFQDKPDQLEHIRARCEAFTHPHTHTLVCMESLVTHRNSPVALKRCITLPSCLVIHRSITGHLHTKCEE